MSIVWSNGCGILIGNGTYNVSIPLSPQGHIQVFVDEAECGLLVYNQHELRARVSCQLPGDNVTIQARNEEHGVETTVCEVMVEGYKYNGT